MNLREKAVQASCKRCLPAVDWCESNNRMVVLKLKTSESVRAVLVKRALSPSVRLREGDNKIASAHSLASCSLHFNFKACASRDEGSDLNG